MKSEKEIRERIDKLKTELKALELKRSKGFSYIGDQQQNLKNRQVREALIVGLKWVLKNE